MKRSFARSFCKRAFVAIFATALTACMTVPKMPQYQPAGQKRISAAKLAVDVAVSKGMENADMPEWANKARDQLIAATAKAFSTDGLLLTPDESRPSVPWKPAEHGLVEPHFTLPNCHRRARDQTAWLEVVAIQSVKDARQRVTYGIAGVIHPWAWLMYPLVPTYIAGSAFGSGVTAVRFCLFSDEGLEPVWAYGEWFHAGLDLRDAGNVERLLTRALEHYRAANVTQ